MILNIFKEYRDLKRKVLELEDRVNSIRTDAMDLLYKPKYQIGTKVKVYDKGVIGVVVDHGVERFSFSEGLLGREYYKILVGDRVIGYVLESQIKPVNEA